MIQDRDHRAAHRLTVQVEAARTADPVKELDGFTVARDLWPESLRPVHPLVIVPVERVEVRGRALEQLLSSFGHSASLYHAAPKLDDRVININPHGTRLVACATGRAGPDVGVRRGLADPEDDIAGRQGLSRRSSWARFVASTASRAGIGLQQDPRKSRCRRPELGQRTRASPSPTDRAEYQMAEERPRQQSKEQGRHDGVSHPESSMPREHHVVLDTRRTQRAGNRVANNAEALESRHIDRDPRSL